MIAKFVVAVIKKGKQISFAPLPSGGYWFSIGHQHYFTRNVSSLCC